MALSIYDLTKGLDFTGLTEATAGDHNNLVDLAATKSDSATEGKGMVLWTVDSALNTPVVPTTPVTVTKWKRYLWLRIPYAGAVVKNATIYAWNDDATSDATYLKWLEANSVDVAALTAAIAAAQADADAAQVTADNAAAAAATAITAANTALNTANNAQTTADNALALAQDPVSQIAAGSITVALLAAVLDLSAKTVTLPPNCVNTAQIVDQAVTAAKLANTLDLSGKVITLPAANSPVLAKVAFTGGVGPTALSGAINISGITRSSTGLFVVSFTTALGTNYVPQVTVMNSANDYFGMVTAKASGSITIQVMDTGGNPRDCDQVFLIIQ